MLDIGPTLKVITKVGGAVIVAWQLAGQFDAALIKHLNASFATKQDIQRIEDKLDQVLLVRPAPSKK